ncbi:NAD-P-binding protein [Panus rudis PR-1116 ss-1]|nr:NAD-P-binding protein [Panus rudis PR-1116 ss-1]
MAHRLPKASKRLVVRKARPDSLAAKKGYPNDAVLETEPVTVPKQGQVIVKINAVSFNHRDLWILKAMYPGIVLGSTFGADGAGVVVASPDNNDPLLNRRVFLVPMRGWESHPEAPDSRFTILGGGGDCAPLGTFAQYVAVERDQIIPSPPHLDDVQVSALPVAGVTAWRAVIVNARVKKGDNVLITGIGGGVALVAFQICLALGANVYVSSGSDEKIRRAIELGAKGGVNYKAKDWPSQLESLLKRHNPKNSLLSSVIDSGGGDIMSSLFKVLAGGARVVVYGMTANPKVTFTMRQVLKNQQLLGSTMGSHKDLVDFASFVAEHKIVPIISHVLDGLEAHEEGFELIARGDHFGKVVVRVKHEPPSAKL